MKRVSQVFCRDSNHRVQEYEWRYIIDIISILGVKDLTEIAGICKPGLKAQSIKSLAKEAVRELEICCKVKEGEDFNRRNTWSILRIKI